MLLLYRAHIENGRMREREGWMEGWMEGGEEGGYFYLPSFSLGPDYFQQQQQQQQQQQLQQQQQQQQQQQPF
eukprot:evm.model.NODE_29609_length_9020_cov_31.105322.1